MPPPSGFIVFTFFRILFCTFYAAFIPEFSLFTLLKNSNDILYHHVGIYAFTNKALMRYVSLERSKLELDRKLEQMRALENSMSIHVGYIKSLPLSVDTEEDLIEIRKIMEK